MKINSYNQLNKEFIFIETNDKVLHEFIQIQQFIYITKDVIVSYFDLFLNNILMEFLASFQL